MRPEIQALRAIAVLSVVIYHLWPERLPGGFVGVDIFFAISGFLIIGHLLRDVQRRGRISLLDFWAKRARRLLPASLIVILATGVATVLLVPDTVWRQWFQEMGASAIYVQNWLLAANAVDYLGADNKPSPTQHFWSLSVEEQFYIFWPIIIVVALAICRAAKSTHARRVLGIVLVVLTVASFAYSVWGVANEPAAAYFVTHSRAWEFGLGGLLAYFFALPLPARDRLRAAVSWLGIAGLVITLVLYRGTTPFPGASALLPVLATLAVIWAGMPATRWAPSALYRLKPVQWIGDISYSFYLWHWAPIVIVPFVLGHSLTTVDKVVILAAAVVVAWLSKRLVEDPVRSARPLVSRSSWVSVTGALAATALVLAACVVVDARTADRFEADAAANAALAEESTCIGAEATVPGADCPRPFEVTPLTNPGVAKTDIGKGVREVDECKQYIAVPDVVSCDIGDVKNPRTTLALIGDSHAGMYLETLDLYGKAHEIKFVTYIKTWCAGTGAQNVFVQGGSPEINKSCTDWGRSVLAEVAASDDIDGAVFSNFTRPYADVAKGSIGREIQPEDYTAAWDELLDAGKRVVVMRDIPFAGPVFVPDCVAQELATYDPCATPVGEALLPEKDDPQLIAAGERPEVKVVDLTDIFCDAKRCHSVIGGLIVYFDNHHLTSAFARSLDEVMGSRIEAVLQ